MRTVFEKLHTMSDEEFCDWIHFEYSRCDWCNPKLIDDKFECDDMDCRECIKNWLHSPVNETEAIE